MNLRRMASLCSSEGTALIESAIVMPVLLMLTLNIVNFGIYIFACVTVDNAARVAVEYSVYNGVAAQFLSTPSFTQIQTLINNDVSSLPNYTAGTNPTLEICSNKNGATTCNGTGTYSPPADPEPALYTTYSADVAYTYTPVFSSFSIPFVNVSLTLPATTIHRQAVMRSMQ